MKVFNTLAVGLSLAVLAASSCATLNTAEQEEIVTQIQKEQVDNPVPLAAGTWVDANGWEYEGLSSGGGPD